MGIERPPSGHDVELAAEVASLVPVVLCSNTDPLHYRYLLATVPSLRLARAAEARARLAATFPTITFRGKELGFDKFDHISSVAGQLTIKGVTKPVTLTVTSFQAMPHPMMKKPALGANAFTVIKRSEFNAGKYAPYVGDDVRIDIAIEAMAQ